MYDLIVLDDDHIVRVTLTEALRDEGYRVVEASDGAEALLLLRGPGSADLLVTDVQLGGDPDGIAVAAAAMSLCPNIRVIYVTGRADALAGVRMGPHQRRLIKPFMPSYLVQVAQELMNS